MTAGGRNGYGLSLPTPHDFGLPERFSSWWGHQEQAFERAITSDKRYVAMVAPTGCHAKGTMVVMYDGTLKTVEDVQVGDVLAGPDSTPRRVLMLHRGRQSMCRVTPTKGDSFVVNEDHHLSVYVTKQGGSAGESARFEVVTPREWFAASKWYRHIRKLWRNGPMEFERRPRLLPVDPHFLGVLLGDGSLKSSVSVCTPDPELVQVMEEQATHWGLRIRASEQENNKAKSYFLSGEVRGPAHKNGLIHALDALGLRVGCDDKFIPHDYLTASIDSRRALLAGLLDTDGYYNSCYEIICKGAQLRDDILFLARSLGLAAYCKEKRAPKICDTVYWRIVLSGEFTELPLRVVRKKPEVRRQIKRTWVTGFEIERLPVGDYFGFELDRDHHYLTSDFTVHHNSGKTIIGETLAKYWGARTAYLVVSRALQSQILGDFDHRYDVRGKQNYECRALVEAGIGQESARCDQAEALCDGCKYREQGCTYFDAVRAATVHDYPLTNYSMWFAMNRYKESGLGEFTGLVCDETHQIPVALCSALRIELGQRAVEQFTRRPLPGTQPLDLWREWATQHLHALRPKLDGMQQAARGTGKQSWELKELKGLVSALEDLSAASGDWVEDRSAWQAKERVGFEPLSPAPYVQRLLFRGIPHVLLMSATLRPKHLELLGLSADEVEFLEFPSTFPLARRPIVHVKTVQHKASMTHEAKLEAVRRVDQAIGARLDRKGLIDTVSFDRSQFIRANSNYAFFMTANSPGRDGLSAQAAMDQFTKASPPRVLIGPSFRTGYDLPGALCEYAILYKVPFMDSRNPLTAARRASDPQWEKLSVMVEIVQFFGRGMRSEWDSCEGLIIDDMFSWFFMDCLQLGFVPQWFAPAVRLNQTIPRPLPKLEE